MENIALYTKFKHAFDKNEQLDFVYWLSENSHAVPSSINGIVDIYKQCHKLSTDLCWEISQTLWQRLKIEIENYLGIWNEYFVDIIDARCEFVNTIGMIKEKFTFYDDAKQWADKIWVDGDHLQKAIVVHTFDSNGELLDVETEILKD